MTRLKITDVPLFDELTGEQQTHILGRSTFSFPQEYSMSSLDQLVNKANDNAEFRRKLIADPTAAAKEAGVSLPAGARLTVHQDTANEMHLVIGGQTEDVPDEAIQLLKKAQQDAAFKARLIKDPVTTARAEIGVVLPPTLKVCVHENTASEVHVVLPLQESAEGELSDMELEAVAGGKGRRRSSSRSSGGPPPCSAMAGCIAIGNSGR